jgi:hypothetical protein
MRRLQPAAVRRKPPSVAIFYLLQPSLGFDRSLFAPVSLNVELHDAGADESRTTRDATRFLWIVTSITAATTDSWLARLPARLIRLRATPRI